MKLLKRLFIIAIIIGVIIFIFDDSDDEPIKNEGEQTYTLMVYMCGSDLESEYGLASEDIEEMLSSQLAKEVNLLIYTGGANDWENSKISSDRNQIFKIEDKELKLVKDDIGKKYMTRSETLEEFVDYVMQNYETDKYALIFWDHGGSSVSGFGYDENDPNEKEELTISEINKALEKYQDKFEFIGFDACLMANFETAYSIKNYARYLVASEEIEAGTGWNYKKILNQLSKNTSQDTIDILKVIVDSYIDENDTFLDDEATLSVIDLKKIDETYDTVLKFLKELKTMSFDANQYKYVSKTLSASKAVGDGEIDTIDLINFAENINIDSTNELINKVKETVVYNKTNTYFDDYNGLSFYFPNQELDYFDKMMENYRNLQFSDEYINIIKEYANIIAGGYRRPNNQKEQYEYHNYDWYDQNFINEYEEYYNDTNIDIQELELTQDGDDFILELTDEDWDLISDIGLSIWYSNNYNGYIDLGIDSYYDLDENDNLKISFDGNWITVNGQYANYEVIESTEKYEKGRIHALLNDEEVYIIILWDEKNPEGKVLGAQKINNNNALFGKGYIEIKPKDKIKFLFDYYDEEYNYIETKTFGNEITVGKKGLKVEYKYIEDGEFLVAYVITDIYGNTYYTETIIME